jgi:signal peptidase I
VSTKNYNSEFIYFVVILFVSYFWIMIWRRRFNHVLFDLFDMISFLVFVAGIVLFVRFFVANPYTVVGASMDPTFKESDFIVVDKVTPRF